MRRIDLVVEHLGQFQWQIVIAKNRSSGLSPDQNVVMETDAAGALEECFARVVGRQIAVDLIEIVRARAFSGKPPTNKFGRLPSGDGRPLFLNTLYLMMVDCGPSGMPGSSGRDHDIAGIDDLDCPVANLPKNDGGPVSGWSRNGDATAGYASEVRYNEAGVLTRRQD
jgi:hypothetical protein